MTPTLPCTLLLLALLAAGPAAAQYKVIDAQGGVTYTDRPVAPPGGKVVVIGRDDPAPTGSAPGSPAVAALPLALRQAVARFPVVLYTAADCGPCDAARQLLQQRGVPYTERGVAGNDAVDALQRLTGGRSVPSLAVGGQVLRGLQPSDWGNTLDLAGYPRQSLLPRNHSQPAATPLVASSQADGAEPPARAAAAEAAPAPAASPATPATPATPSGIRF